MDNNQEINNCIISIFLHVLCFPFDSNVGIRIGTIGIPSNTHQVLTDKAQTDVTLRQHRPRRVTSCPMGWLPYAMIIPLRGWLIQW